MKIRDILTETTTSGGIAAVAAPLGAAQHRDQGVYETAPGRQDLAYQVAQMLARTHGNLRSATEDEILKAAAHMLSQMDFKTVQINNIMANPDFLSDVIEHVRGPMRRDSTDIAEASMQQRIKTTLRKLDPTIKDRLRNRANDEFDFGLDKAGSNWVSGAPAGAHLKHSAHLDRLARGEKPFQDIPRRATKESLRDGEYHVATVTLDDGSQKRIAITQDEGYRQKIQQHFAQQGKTVRDIKIDHAVRKD